MWAGGRAAGANQTTIESMDHHKDPGNYFTAAAELAPPEYCDPVIEAYKSGVDRTLLRENLQLSVDQRFRKFAEFVKYASELREAGRRATTAG